MCSVSPRRQQSACESTRRKEAARLASGALIPSPCGQVYEASPGGCKVHRTSSTPIQKTDRSTHLSPSHPLLHLLTLPLLMLAASPPPNCSLVFLLKTLPLACED
ncbi:hypothetical protein BaRGS_00016963 [Batillaria attramentaria]|uniref:Uncharacterized protein n=1 Tax=Batillaria attramentaria TaxID=370345 RepID=A0ABD0KX87_9CAEN